MLPPRVGGGPVVAAPAPVLPEAAMSALAPLRAAEVGGCGGGGAGVPAN